MSNKVSELKAALGAAARPNKYRVNFAIPAAIPTVGDLSTANTLCKASSFPSVTLGQIETWNQGRKLVLPGDTSYATTWTLTMYATEDHALRKDFIAWMRYVDHFQDNEHTGVPADVMGEMSVQQLDSQGNDTVTYTFHNVFVQEIGEVSIGDDQADTALEFDVTFSFTDWVVGDTGTNQPETGNASTLNTITS